MEIPNSNIAADMQQLRENQDGTLQGGFLSMANGRPRIIIDNDHVNEKTNQCGNSRCFDKVNESCENHRCASNHNLMGGLGVCHNYSCGKIP